MLVYITTPYDNARSQEAGVSSADESSADGDCTMKQIQAYSHNNSMLRWARKPPPSLDSRDSLTIFSTQSGMLHNAIIRPFPDFTLLLQLHPCVGMAPLGLRLPSECSRI